MTSLEDPVKLIGKVCGGECQECRSGPADRLRKFKEGNVCVCVWARVSDRDGGRAYIYIDIY